MEALVYTFLLIGTLGKSRTGYPVRGSRNNSKSQNTQCQIDAQNKDDQM